MANANILLCIDGRDLNYASACKYLFSRRFNSVQFMTEFPSSFAMLKAKADMRKCSVIATTSLELIRRFSGKSLEGTAADNVGYMCDRAGLRMILLPPLVQKFSVPHGEFILDHFIKKLAAPEDFLAKDVFTWEFLTPENYESTFLRWSAKAKVVAVDIETKKDNRIITSVAYTALMPNNRTETRVIRFDEKNALLATTMMRNMNRMRVPKIMQNGGYDSTYFLRYNAPLWGYLYDTYHFMHCLFPELPKDLAFISSFVLRDFEYWKDEIGINVYEYNAKDTHNTLWTMLGLLDYANKPEYQYAYQNYKILFPKLFPCIQCGLEGIAADLDRRDKIRVERLESVNKSLQSLGTLLGIDTYRTEKKPGEFEVTGFNPGSPKQVVALLTGLGYPAESSDAKAIQAFRETSAVNARVADLIDEYRESAKAISTYIDVELFHGRLLYELNPSGTESGRLASKASNFWCGTQIQNMPPYAKPIFKADEGFELFEVDKSQAESWCTGYLSQDANLINTLHTSPDFHCTNCSLFFGIPFEELYDVVKKKPIRKDIRNIGKRVNHGANYNMGEYVLWQTMGTKEVLEAKRILKLPEDWEVLQVTRYLLQVFEKTYPGVKKDFYRSIKEEVKETGKLVGPTGWTRRTFLKPWQSKPDLNALVAHPPQSLSVMLVNTAFYDVWKNLQHGKYKGLLRLKAQIHDSLFGQVKIGHSYIVEEIEKRMRVPVKVHGRTLVIPGDLKSGAKYWSELKD